jgi:prolyl-tRNA synthetase
MWCGNPACEDGVKEKTGVGSRCILTDEPPVGEKCVYCGKPADKLVVWAKAY